MNSRSALRLSLFLAAFCFAFAVLGTQRAEAQGFAVNQFRPGELVSDGFALSRPNAFGHLQWGGQLVFDYSLNPLVFETNLGDAGSESAAIIEHMLNAHVMGTFGLWDRVMFYVHLPVALAMTGDIVPGYPPADGTSIGDPVLGGRIRLLGDSGDVFSLGAQLAVSIPLADIVNQSQTYGGDRTATFLPKIVGELRFGAIRIPMNVGFRFRGATALANLLVSQELTLGIGMIFPIVENTLDGHIELYGTTGLERFFDRATSPLEAIAGLKWRPTGGWRIGVAAGPGLTRGYGAPDMRALLTAGWAPYDDAAPPVDDDRDRDGIKNDDDQCPDEPEDRDDFQDEDGCPDPDNDRDRILDVDDQCPLEPEDYDQFRDEDGCPDPDNDRDGILDVDDQCPMEPEDTDGLLDEDGCPEDDADGDGVLDVDDACVLTPGIRSEQRECNGCPALACMNAEEGTIVILERVEFATNLDVILERSQPVLDAVYQILSTNNQIRRLRIEGHTDDRAGDDYNLDLSQRRANSVMRWLVDHGIDPSRLVAEGFGERRPIADNRRAEGRQTNRRVEFHIIDPAPPGASDSSESVPPESQR